MSTYTIYGTSGDDRLDTYDYAGSTLYGWTVKQGLAMGYDSYNIEGGDGDDTLSASFIGNENRWRKDLLIGGNGI